MINLSSLSLQSSDSDSSPVNSKMDQGVQYSALKSDMT